MSIYFNNSSINDWNFDTSNADKDSIVYDGYRYSYDTIVSALNQILYSNNIVPFFDGCLSLERDFLFAKKSIYVY